MVAKRKGAAGAEENHQEKGHQEKGQESEAEMNRKLKPWVEAVLILACLSLLGWIVFVACTAPVNVNVKAEQWKCDIQQSGANGSVDFKGCTKVDGDAPTNQDSTDAPESIQGAIGKPRDVRWN